MNGKRGLTRILIAVAVLAIVVVSAVAGCKSAPEEVADVRTELNIRLQYAAAKQFDPAAIAKAAEYYVTRNLFDGLVRFKPGGFEIQPDLADSWEISSDGLEYTFHLHQGVQFHKGYGEMTADDVVFSISRLTTTEMGYLFETVIDKVEALDTYTVKITLKKPYAPLLTYLAYRNAFIVSKAAVEEKGDGFAQDPIGTGPFVFQEMTEDKKVIVTRNDDYFMGPSEITKITFNPITEEEVAAMALENGELDVMWTRGDAAIADQLAQNPDITVVHANSVTTRFVGLNPSYAPLADPKVRQALAYALDREAVSEATGGFEAPAKSIYNPLFFGYTEDLPNFPTYDLAKAKELLAESGYPDGFDLELLCSSRSPDPIVGQVVQASFQALGINCTLNSMEQGAYSEAKDLGNYQAVLMGVGRPPDPDLLLMEAFHSSAIGQGRANNGFYAGADDLIEQAAMEVDETKRAELYTQIAIKILDDMPQIPVSNTQYGAAWRLPVVDYIPGINNEFDAYTIVLGSGD